jgi:predicted nucleic acid-binding protein
MIVIDTSIWADHIHKAVPELELLLERDLVVQHPFVTGELALGNPADRQGLVATLEALPQADVKETGRLLAFAERERLGGTGIGYVDAHLLLAAHSQRALLWTRDRRLHAQAERLGVAYTP